MLMPSLSVLTVNGISCRLMDLRFQRRYFDAENVEKNEKDFYRGSYFFILFPPVPVFCEKRYDRFCSLLLGRKKDYEGRDALPIFRWPSPV